MIRETNIRDSYKYYRRNVECPLDIKTYMHIATGFIAFKIRKMFEGFDVQLSGGRSLGTVGIRGRRMKFDENGSVVGLAPDWKNTIELWNRNPEAKANKEFIYHLNEHTNGIKYNLVWWKAGMLIADKLLYSLTFCKPNRRKLTRLLKEGKEYITD